MVIKKKQSYSRTHKRRNSINKKLIINVSPKLSYFKGTCYKLFKKVNYSNIDLLLNKQVQ